MEIIVLILSLMIAGCAILIQGILESNMPIIMLCLSGLWFFLSFARILYLESRYTSNDTKKTIIFIFKNKRFQDFWILPLLLFLSTLEIITVFLLMSVIFITTGKGFREQKRIMNIKKYANKEDEYDGIITEEYRKEYPDEKVEWNNSGWRCIYTKKEKKLSTFKTLLDFSNNEDEKNRLRRIIASIENS